MGQMTVSKHIDAPQDKVFAVITDLEGARERITGIEKVELLTDGPFGKGTRWRETRIMFKREATEEMEITAWDPPDGYTLGCESCGARYDMALTLVSDGAATSMEWRIETTPITFMARVMSVFSGLMSGMMKKCMAQDMEDIKAAAETEGAPVA